MSLVNDGEPWESIQQYEISRRTHSNKVLNKRKSNLKNYNEVSSNRRIRKNIVLINGIKILYYKVRKRLHLGEVIKRRNKNHEANKNKNTSKKRKDEIAKHYEVSNKINLNIFKKSFTEYYKVGYKTNADRNIKKRKDLRGKYREIINRTQYIDRANLQKNKTVHKDSCRSIKIVEDKKEDRFKNDHEVSNKIHTEVLQKKNNGYHKASNRRKSTELIEKRKKYKQSEVSNRNVCTEVEKKSKNKLGTIKWRQESRWRICTVLIPLIISNIVGLTDAESLTSRVLASFLGYPTTCNIGVEVRPCTLSLSCWLRGGTRVRGCGSSWLFSCCLPPEFERNDFDNMVPSSDWRYKVVPPKLRQVPQRNVVPTNVFRRRVDEDMSQIECGLPSTRILQKRIIGGREARFAEFPWQAHVRISEFQCGGVLISKWFVATAAHCVSRARPRDIAIWLGALDTAAGTNTARKLGVVQKILHPLFQFRMTQPDRYDIALLRLSRPITYTTHILPICLPDMDIELQGKSGVIAGWGKTDASNGHTGTNLLRSATVPILSTKQCINWHQSKQILVEIHSEMICAGHSDGHQDACLGDSGGPLIVFDSGRYYLVGITSAGFGCGVDHQPGIYHNVKTTTNWIKDVISPVANYIDF